MLQDPVCNILLALVTWKFTLKYRLLGKVTFDSLDSIRGTVLGLCKTIHEPGRHFQCLLIKSPHTVIINAQNTFSVCQINPTALTPVSHIAPTDLQTASLTLPCFHTLLHLSSEPRKGVRL
ncbi:hypothetical protein FKM82_005611 [Ascaphus truei]